jgi:hypothetical protein
MNKKRMKKLRLLFFAATLAATCAGFASCSKDDDDSSSLLIGTWQSVSYEGMDGEYPISGADTGTILTFRSDGTMAATEKGESSGIQWKMDGDLLYCRFDDEEEECFRIVKLTSTELILDEWYDPDDDSGSYYNCTYEKIK